MSKIQTVLSLLLFLVVLFSMDIVFGNPIRETFRNQVGAAGQRDIKTNDLGSELNYKPSIRTNTLNGNMVYSGKGFLGSTAPQYKSDDQPLFFGF